MEMGKTLSHLDQHLAEPVTVRQLARMAGMSETTFMRRFRLVTGHSPIDYLIRLRIDRACELLQRDDLRITDVAFRSGFEDSNYFSRQFRRIMGCSPRDYRRGR
jgi:AraC-like DNA-binding protein